MSVQHLIDLSHRIRRRFRSAAGTQSGNCVVALPLLLTVAVDPALAQSAGSSFCDTALVETGRNILEIIQLGGPLLGAILTVGATVTLPAVRNVDVKKELKEVRKQGLVWGIIVAPLSISLIQFLLNGVVAGGSSCGF